MLYLILIAILKNRDNLANNKVSGAYVKFKRFYVSFFLVKKWNIFVIWMLKFWYHVFFKYACLTCCEWSNLPA